MMDIKELFNIPIWITVISLIVLFVSLFSFFRLSYKNNEQSKNMLYFTVFMVVFTFFTYIWSDIKEISTDFLKITKVDELAEDYLEKYNKANSHLDNLQVIINEATKTIEEINNRSDFYDLVYQAKNDDRFALGELRKLIFTNNTFKEQSKLVYHNIALELRFFFERSIWLEERIVASNYLNDINFEENIQDNLSNMFIQLDGYYDQLYLLKEIRFSDKINDKEKIIFLSASFENCPLIKITFLSAKYCLDIMVEKGEDISGLDMLDFDSIYKKILEKYPEVKERKIEVKWKNSR